MTRIIEFLMNIFEKIYAIFAICFAIALITCLFVIPELREPKVMLIASGVGLFVNVILMFIVFKDLFFRAALSKEKKLVWTVILLVFWPAIFFYLPIHGFRRPI